MTEKRVMTVLIFGLGLLVLCSSGVALAETQAATGPSTDGPGETVTIDDAVQEADGTVQALVTLTDAPAETDPGALQAHAAASQAPLEAFAAETPGVTVENRFWLTNAAVVSIDTGRVSPEALAAVDGVEAIVDNAEVESLDGVDTATSDGRSAVKPAAHATPGSVSTSPGTTERVGTTQSYQTTYGLAQINATTVWDEYGTRGANVSVAVLDTGVDPDHPDIDLSGWAEFYYENGTQVEDSTPMDFDPGGHGTHTSGTVTGGNESGEYIGVAPAADLYHGAVLTEDCSNDCVGSFSQIIGGMQWAVANDMDVLSMSLGAEGFYSQFVDPVRNAMDAGTVVVTSTGNNGSGYSGSPGNVYDAISVGATDSNEDVAGFSSGQVVDTDVDWGSAAPAEWPEEYVVPTVSAPGYAVKSAQVGGGYTDKFGTSMATPHVAGAVALLEAVPDRGGTPEEVATALENSARKPPDASEPAGVRDIRYGSGIVDVPALVEEFAPPGEPDLVLDSVDAPAAVNVSETLSVDYAITNRGNASGTESFVDLYEGGTILATDTDVTVDPGETVNGTLSYEAVESNYEPGDTLDLSVELFDFADTVANTTAVTAENRTATLSSPSVGDGDGNLTITEGAEANASVAVQNVGGTTEAFTVELNISGGPSTGQEQQTTAALAHGDSETLTFASVTGDLAPGDYVVTFAHEGSSVSGNLTVEPPPAAIFDVSIANATEPVAGENLTVVATVTNTGDAAGTQPVTLDAGSLGTVDETISLGAGNQTNASLTLDTTAGDAGTYDATVASANDTANATVTVLQDATFEVDLLGTTTSGGSVNLSYRVDNVGDVAGTATANVTANGTLVDGREHALDGGANVTDSVTYELGSGDPPGVLLAVQTEDDIAESTISVAPADLELTVVETNASAVAGENLTVTSTLTNTGDVAGTQTVSLDAGDLGTDNATVSLGAGNETNVTLAVTTTPDDAGTYNATVASANDTANLSVTVLQRATFGVDLLGTSTAEGVVNLTYRVENVGDVAGTETANFTVNGSLVDDREYTLAPGANVTDSVTYALQSGDAPAVLLAVATPDAVAEQSLPVDPAALELAVVETNSPVVAGEDLTVTVEGTNVGQEPANETLELRGPDDVVVDTAVVTVTGNATERTTLTWPTEGEDVGPATLTVENESGGEHPVPVEVLSPAVYEATLVDANETVAGENLSVTATVTNTGGVAGTQTVTLSVPGLGVDNATVSLGAGNATNVTFSVATALPDADTYDATVETGDETVNATLSVAVPPVVGENPPRDLDGDGRHEDVRGSGDVGIFDVQTLFQNLDSPVVTTYPDRFSFQGDGGDEVGVFDVQALFSQLG